MTQAVQRDQAPHAVLRIVAKSGEILRHAVVQVQRDGSVKPNIDPDVEAYEVLETFDEFKPAAAKRAALQRTIGKYKTNNPAHVPTGWARKAIELPAFMPQLPEDPRERRSLFLDLDIEAQEEVFYALTLATGLPRKRIEQWFMVLPEEVAHIDDMITVAARAELDLRIAKKMVGHALKDNSPTSMTATLFLCKVFLGFNEQGMQGVQEDPLVNLNAAKSLFDDLTVVETHRDEKGNTVTEPTHMRLVKGSKQA